RVEQVGGMPGIERQWDARRLGGEAGDARAAGFQRAREVRADEARGASDEDGATVQLHGATPPLTSTARDAAGSTRPSHARRRGAGSPAASRSGGGSW